MLFEGIKQRARRLSEVRDVAFLHPSLFSRLEKLRYPVHSARGRSGRGERGDSEEEKEGGRGRSEGIRGGRREGKKGGN